MIAPHSHPSSVLFISGKSGSQPKCVCACVCAHVCARALSRFSHVLLFATLWTIACQPSLYLSGILLARIQPKHFLSISSSKVSSRPRDWICMSYVFCLGGRTLYCCCCCWIASVVSDSVRPHRRQPTRLLCPWSSPGKNTGVGSYFLLQCVKVKSESEVAQSCPTLVGTPWTAAHQAPPSMGFSRQEYWSGVPLSSPGFFTSAT